MNIDNIDALLRQIEVFYLTGELTQAHQLSIDGINAGFERAPLLDWVVRLRGELQGKQQLEALQKANARLKLNNQIAAQQYIQQLLAEPKYADPLRLERHGQKISSQNDEDGIVLEIFRRIGTTNKRFVEIGVGNGFENNTYALLQQGWSGTWVEAHVKKSAFIMRTFVEQITAGQLEIINSFVRVDNVNQLLQKYADQPEIDLLSIDIDGNDYHVYDALTVVAPRVAIVEYNPKYPPPLSLAMAYDPNYAWSREKDCGASLSAVTKLANAKGYDLVGCNITGANAFFVRKDLAAGKFAQPATAENFYHTARYYLWEAEGFPIGFPGNMQPKIEI